MKKLFLILSLSFASFVNAATLADNFVASDGKVFQIHSVNSVEKGAGVIYVKQTTGSIQGFADTNGSVWTKVSNYINYTGHYVRIQGTDRYMNTWFTTEISCISNQSAFGYTTGQAEYFADGCALQNAVKALSN